MIAKLKRAQPEPIVAELRLTKTQKNEILNSFLVHFPKALPLPDIKLQAFAAQVAESRTAEIVPVYFAQQRVVLAFARKAALQWLVDLIQTPVVEGTQ